MPSPGVGFLALLVFVALSASAQVAVLPNVTVKPALTINLWPGAAPGETGNIGPEHVLPDRPRPFDQITDVSVPTLLVFQPAPEKRTGTSMLVIPGGGLDRLALEIEGYEVAEWLNAKGITAFVLKYRVPARRGGPRYKVGLQDAQRAMGLIRANAAAWKIDADSVGSIGFSAGAEINVMLSVYHKEPRQYPRVDAADDLSSRPDFNIAVYAGGFTTATTLREDIASRIDRSSSPPMFITHAFDDAAQGSIILMGALKRANVASEIHVFAAGAHGFGARDSGGPVGQWRDLCLSWLGWQGYLDAPVSRVYARDFAKALNGAAASLPRFGAGARSANLDQAFAAQHRFERDQVSHGAVLAGYRAAGGAKPVHGVLFKGGRIDASAAGAIVLDPKRPVQIETAIGYVIATDISTKLLVPRQALTTVEAIVPVVELPLNLGALMGSKPGAPDLVAANAGAHRFIVGTAVNLKTIADPDALAVSLKRDGKPLHAAKGSDAKGGQARHLMALINQIVEQGHVIHRGDILVTGALGGAKPGEQGSFEADFGTLGRIAFKLE